VKRPGVRLGGLADIAVEEPPIEEVIDRVFSGERPLTRVRRHTARLDHRLVSVADASRHGRLAPLVSSRGGSIAAQRLRAS
jgi:hypothetical protein